MNNFQLIELGVPLLEIEKELAKKRQSAGGKIGRSLQLGLAPDDTKPAFKKSKATAAVAKKVGVSTRTFERGKKILEKASEDDKQRLREGKTSISKVYRELVTPEGEVEQPAPAEAETLVDNALIEQNRMALLAILKNLLEKELFCPSCGHSMFECSKCHMPLQDSVQLGGEDKPSQRV